MSSVQSSQRPNWTLPAASSHERKSRLSAALLGRPVFAPQFWDAARWMSALNAHQERFATPLKSYVMKRSHHQKDPVLDFLFEYYNFKPISLLRWTPGVGVVLAGAETKRAQKQLGLGKLTPHSEGGMWLDPTAFPDKRIKALEWIIALLRATQQRSPLFGCFGMHEWAMVYRDEDSKRHPYPLRLAPDELARFVESRPLVCTHFDAYRFFTQPARPRNRLALSRERQIDDEQPGCLHANMDLYKWTYKMSPWLPAELLGDAFLLAYQARLIDMRASPYDMRSRGLAPIPIETEAGRQEYLLVQRELAIQARAVRQRLLRACQSLLAAVRRPAFS